MESQKIVDEYLREQLKKEGMESIRVVHLQKFESKNDVDMYVKIVKFLSLKGLEAKKKRYDK